jgi:cell wall-associated NlpC family hydrolase
VVTRPLTIRSPLIRRCLVAAAGVTLVGGLVSYAAAVQAAPQPTVTQVTAQVSKLTTQENKAVQQFDVVNQQLKAADATLKQVTAQVARDQAEFTASRKALAQAAAAAYEDGNLTSMATLLTTDNPAVVLSKASMLVQLSSARYAEMHQVISAARQLTGAQNQAKRAAQAISALRDQRKSQADSIGKALQQKKSLLATLTAQQQAQVTTKASPGGGSTGSTTATDPLPASGGGGNAAVAFAYKQLGCPYVYGATGPCPQGYDCSGLAQAAWAAAGVSIPRDTYEQWAALPHVPLSDLQPGDLIYFNGESHVGIYVGGGDIIDAPQPGQNVEKVPLAGWYQSTEDGAVRP